MMRQFLFLIIVFRQLTAAPEIGSFAGGFLRMGSTARSVAMGSGLTAAIDGGFSSYHNPATLPFVGKRTLTLLNHLLPLDRYFVATSFSSPLPPTAGVNVAFVGSGVGDIEGRDESGQMIGNFSTSENAVFVSFANEYVKGLSIGINLKVLYHVLNLDEKLVGKGVGVDVGFYFHHLKNLDIGFVLQDLNAKFAWNTTNYFDESGRTYEDKFPLQLRAGLRYAPKTFEVVGDFTVFYDQESQQVLGNRLRIGGEFFLRKEIAIRAGVDDLFPAIGIGLNYSLLNRDDTNVDYTIQIAREGTGFNHILSYVFSF